MLKLLSLCVCCGAVASGCGGNPATLFVGIYAVSGSITYTSDVGSSLGPTTVNESVSIAQTQTTGKVLYNDSSCNISAIVTNNTYAINQLTCPAQSITDPTCAQCTLTISYTGGTGTLQGSILTVSATGKYAATCSMCTGALSGTFNEAFNGPKS